MPQHVTLSELCRRHLALEPHEAVAVAQQIIQQARDIAETTPHADGFGLQHIELRDDGTLRWTGLPITQPEEVACLLRACMSKATGKVPPPLLYAIARALRDVEAPGFASLEEFSAALVRFERGSRDEVLRALAARVLPSRPAGAVAAPAGPAAIAPRRSGHARRYAAVAAVLLFAVSFAVLAELGGRRNGADTRTTETSVTDVSPEVRDQVTHPDVVVERRTEQVTAAADAPTQSNAGSEGSHETAPSAPVRAVNLNRPVFSPAFDREGGMFFHTGGNGDVRSALMASDIAAGRSRATTIFDDGSRNYHVRPSPDGSLIAFDSDRDGERGVYVARRDGSGVRRVSGEGFAAVPAWSPDGRQLTFVRAERNRPKVWNLWLLSLDSGDVRRLTRFAYGQTWSASWFRDRERVLFSHEDRLITLHLGSGRTREYRSPVPRQLVRTPAVSPDGSRVVFQVRRSGVWVLDLRTETFERILDDRTAEEFAWSPDGRRIAFHSRRGGRWGIWTMPAA